MSDIMEFFPYPTPRGSQEIVLRTIEKKWSDYDCFVVRVPVAGGKSAIGTTVQGWALENGASAGIVTPNNLLRDQYLAEFDGLHTLKAQQDYWLERYQMNVKTFMKKHKIKFGPKGCQYNEDRKLVKRVGKPIVVNFMSYLAHSLHRNVMIVDEAHKMLPMLQGLHATKLWRFKERYPADLRTVQQLLLWMESQSVLSNNMKKLRGELKSLTATSTIQFTTDYYRGVEKDCIKIVPLDVSNEAPVLWPKKTKKILMMSATIDATDVDNMGLGTKKVLYIDVESETPEKQRPIIFSPVGSMSQKNKADTLPSLIEEIRKITKSHDGQKGFIHATYELAAILRREFGSDPRFIFHGSSDKQFQFQRFLDHAPESGVVFIGSGMHEGIDLKGTKGAYQIITNTPFLSLSSPQYRYLAANKPREYIWLTTKEMLQASGRICRTPEDYGKTYILDKDAELWITKAREYGQLPSWYNPKGI